MHIADSHTCLDSLKCTHLVEQIIQTFIQVVEIQQHNSATCFHAYLDLVNVATHLHINGRQNLCKAPYLMFVLDTIGAVHTCV